MKEILVELFTNNARIILFLHVIGAVVWVGGMIAIRFAVHPALAHIEDVKVRLARTLEILKNFFQIAVFFIVVIVVTAVIMSIGLNLKESSPSLYTLVHVKELIWLIMTINFSLMYWRRSRAEKLFISGDLAGAKSYLEPFPNIMLPINILLGLLALALGGVLRGF